MGFVGQDERIVEWCGSSGFKGSGVERIVKLGRKQHGLSHSWWVSARSSFSPTQLQSL
jgi:hypothetical protein